jgi:hypothetical protein
MTPRLMATMAGALLLCAASNAHAAQCAAGAYRAGCVGPNGAVATGPNGARAATTHTTTVHTNAPAGTTVKGPAGNTATKGVQQGCGWVNGKRVCR